MVNEADMNMEADDLLEAMSYAYNWCVHKVDVEGNAGVKLGYKKKMAKYAKLQYLLERSRLSKGDKVCLMKCR